MANARIWIFNVEHGSCAFVHAPSGATFMIDCGRAQFFSPARYLTQTEGHTRLDKLLVTHPHDDHIQDIGEIAQNFTPTLLHRRQYNWPSLEADAGGDHPNLRVYATFQEGYTVNLPDPDWGSMSVFYHGLSIQEAFDVDQAKYVNNSSLVTIIQFAGTKLIFPGDLERAAWLTLLQRQEFRTAIAGTTIFVASHHGHSSGYTPEIFDVMGLPFVNIISCRTRDESIEPAYRTHERALGMDWDGETRYSLTTRHDGSLRIDIDPNGSTQIRGLNLGTNI